MTTNKDMNAAAVLAAVQACITELQGIKSWTQLREHDGRIRERGYSGRHFEFVIRKVCDELSIFDWWDETLSLSQLKEMEKFLKTAIKMGYTGYVCFKVGAAGCSHGMWAHKNETEDGYSPDGECLFRGFRTGSYNEWDACLADGTWFHEIIDEKSEFTLKEVQNMLKGVQA